jgi:hypothetical protein
MNKSLIVLTLLMLIWDTRAAFALAPDEKPRVIVLTDIENEPDDAQSLVRFLTYAHMFDVEGIIATTSVWLKDRTAEWRIHEILEAYQKVQPNLSRHASAYPTYETLKAVTKSGLPKYGMEGVGEGLDSEGSEWIIQALKKDDPRPLWVLAWGGPNCLAQALWKLEQTVSPGLLEGYVLKLRVYAISDQDPSGPWMRKNFPDLFYICTPGYAHGGREGYHFATWTGISGDTFHGRFPGGNKEVIGREWLREHIQENHGPLGKEYPDVKYLMEGDTPSFLYLIENGLGSREHPNYGSWGGRYAYYRPKTELFFFEPETRSLWTNAADEVFSGVDQQYHTSDQATIWRWREAFQNDFAARMDWCVKPYEEANHPPLPALAHDAVLEVVEGDKVVLKAEGCGDPDGDELSYRWIYYREAGNSVYWLKMSEENSPRASFTAPSMGFPQEMHFVLAVTDHGQPALTRYKRVVVKVIP